MNGVARGFVRALGIKSEFRHRIRAPWVGGLLVTSLFVCGALPGLAAALERENTRPAIAGIERGGLLGRDKPVIVKGEAEPRSKVELFDRDQHVGSSVAGGDGKWIVSLSKRLSKGPHVFRVKTESNGTKAQTSDPLIVYVVRHGDTLWSIASRFYDAGYLWPIISNSYMNVVPNPHRIYPAQVLILPDEDFDVSDERFAPFEFKNTAGGSGKEQKQLSPVPVNRPPRPSFDTVRVNPDGTLYISGKASPFATIKLYYRGREISTTKADAEGRWELLSVSISGLPQGAYIKVKAMAISQNNQRSWSQGDKEIYVPASEKQSEGEGGGGGTKPLPKLPSLAEVPDLTTPVVNVANWSEKWGVRIAGHAGANSKVDVFDSGQLIGTTTSDPSGEWVFTPNRPLNPGTWNLAVRAENTGGAKIWSDNVDLIIPDSVELRVESNGGPKTNEDRPTRIASDHIYQNALNGLVDGALHHNDISPMFVDDLKVLTAVIGYPGASAEQLGAIISDEYRKTFDIKIGNEMEVRLVGAKSAFDISPDHAVKSIVTIDSPAEFKWYVRAKEKGEHTLTMYVSAIVTINGDSVPKTTPEEIKVKVDVRPKSFWESLLGIWNSFLAFIRDYWIPIFGGAVGSFLFARYQGWLGRSSGQS